MARGTRHRAARCIALATALVALGGAAPVFSAEAPVHVAAQAATVPTSGQAPAGQTLPAGTGVFTFTGWAGKPLRVFYYAPEQVTEKTRVLFVIHGMGRNAEGYRDAWVKHARAGNYIVLTPEYSLEKFPTPLSFNVGHVFDEGGVARPRDQWSFAAIEPMFNMVRKATGTKVPKYAIYGHSAGGQFVHRFVALMPDARYSRAVAANAGWYSFPDLSIDFPYGLNGAPIDREGLKDALQKPLTILLGTADNDPNHHQLSKSPGSMLQGPHRLARGNAYYAHGETVAAQLGVRYAWKISYARDVAHSNTKISEYAQKLVWQ